MTGFLVVDGLILIEYINFFYPLSTVHEMIFRDVQGKSIDRRYVEYIGQWLIVLVIVWGHLPYLFIEVGNVQIDSESLLFVGLSVEVIAAISLYLGNKEGHVVCLELIWGKYFGSGSVKVIILCPRWSPLPHSLITVEPSVIINGIPIAIYLIVLINISVVVLTCFKHYGHTRLLFCKVQLI